MANAAPAIHNEPVLIVGAGPAGLATAAMLQRAGIASRILEAGPDLGHSWTRYYDKLHLHTGRRISGLPGFPLPRDYPVFVPRDAYLQYLRAYARRFNLAITPHQRVARAIRTTAGWRVETHDRAWEAPVLVAASGIASRPHTPPLPGREHFGGIVLHSADYHTAQPFAGQDVLVVGVGNSGSEIALDLARTARSVTLAVRSPMTVVPRRMFGIPTSELAIPLSYLPRPVVRRVRAVLGTPTTRRLRALGLPVGPPDQFPVIGVEILDALKAGRISAAGGVAGFMPGGVRFADGSERAFDAVVLATGFRPALEYLADYVSVPDEKQAHFPTLVPGQPNLYLVGLYYDGLRGTLFNIGRQAREVAHRVHQSGAARVPDSWVIAAQRD